MKQTIVKNTSWLYCIMRNSKLLVSTLMLLSIFSCKENIESTNLHGKVVGEWTVTSTEPIVSDSTKSIDVQAILLQHGVSLLNMRASISTSQFSFYSEGDTVSSEPYTIANDELVFSNGVTASVIVVDDDHLTIDLGKVRYHLSQLTDTH